MGKKTGLKLNKETIAKLNMLDIEQIQDKVLEQINAGKAGTLTYTCHNACPCTAPITG